MPEEQQPGQQQPYKERSVKQVQEHALDSYKSYWPFVMAVAVMVLLLGLITNLIVLGVGVIFTIVAIIGWGFEHQK